MSKCKKKLKNKLFDLYSKNLSIYRPEYREKFLCPICLNEFDRDELDRLTCAHVFPDKLGGRLLTLSCTACDSKIGSEFNWHAVEEKKVQAWLKEPKRGRFIPKKGLAINIISEWDFEKSTISIYPPSRDIPREIWKRWIDDIRGNSPDGGPYKFSIELKEPTFVPTRRDISHIHSAFLMMFYQFGYEYVLSPNADSIRQMFNGSDLSWKPSKLVRTDISALESNGQHINSPVIGIVVEPKELCSFAVLLPSLNAGDSANIVFLPGIDEKWSDFYIKQEVTRIPNKKYTMVYPTQIRIHTPDRNGSADLRGDINYDINNPENKGIANKLYHIFTKLEKSDISNLDMHITVRSSAVH